VAPLIYIANVSLDGYIEDADGNFDFTVPSDDVFAFITELIRPVRTFAYGRKLYETMAVWETMPELAEESALRWEFARVWQSARKVVYSSTRTEPLTKDTTIEAKFDPDAARALKDSTTGDLAVGGAELAAHCFAAGLVDEIHLFVAPVTIGTGKPALPRDQRIALELLDERRFASAVYLRYAVSA